MKYYISFVVFIFFNIILHFNILNSKFGYTDDIKMLFLKFESNFRKQNSDCLLNAYSLNSNLENIN